MSESLSGELRRADYGIFQDVFLSSGFIQMSDTWSNEELKAAVEAYVEMQRKERTDQIFTKRQHYRKLAELFGRSEKAYEYRMQNISYVLSLMGRAWLPGLKPKRNIDAKVAGKIEKLLGEIEGQKTQPVAAFEIAVRDEGGQTNLPRPSGNPYPKSRRTTVTQFRRDATVKAWVLQQAGGVCEGCEKTRSF